MDPQYLPGANHEAFTEWALSQGVMTDAVTPARFPGRGLGMMATRKIKVGRSKPIETANNADQESLCIERRSCCKSTYQCNFHSGPSS